MELILIRHGQPQRVVKEDGTPADPPLSPLGMEQARKLARWMADERLDALYSSPLLRASMTAEFLGKTQGREIIVEPGVMEFDHRSEVYIPMEELKATDYEGWRTLVEGGFEKMVDVKGFTERVVSSLERIIAENRGKRVAVVCHGGIINVWAAYVLGIDRFLFFAPEYTSINRFLASGKGHRSV